ncbi:hypothetical protein DFAR_1110022 [Desulfarculales bacterium]
MGFAAGVGFCRLVAWSAVLEQGRLLVIKACPGRQVSGAELRLLGWRVPMVAGQGG